jgi:hypothetical protein
MSDAAGTLAIPPNLEYFSTPEGAVVRRHWRTPKVYYLILFLLVWEPFIVVWYVRAFRAHTPLTSGIMVLPLVTDVTITATNVRVRTGPVPQYGDRVIPVAAIARVFVKESVRGEGHRFRRVVYLTRQAREKILLRISDKSQADFIAATIRATLALPES